VGGGRSRLRARSRVQEDIIDVPKRGYLNTTSAQMSCRMNGWYQDWWRRSSAHAAGMDGCRSRGTRSSRGGRRGARTDKIGAAAARQHWSRIGSRYSREPHHHHSPYSLLAIPFFNKGNIIISQRYELHPASATT
jgi:hypothetical protein